MTINEAIKHEKGVAQKYYNEGFLCYANPNNKDLDDCIEWAKEHERPAERLKKLKEYERLEEQGLLRKFPCKPGDILFILTEDSPTGIEETTCNRIIINKKNIIVQAPCVHDDWGRALWNLKPKHFGETVFLTREKAKEMLRKPRDERRI